MQCLINKEILMELNKELLKGHKLQIEYNKHSQEVKILRLTAKKIKASKVSTGM